MKRKTNWKTTAFYAEFHARRIYRDLIEIRDDGDITAENKLIQMSLIIDDLKKVADTVKEGLL